MIVLEVSDLQKSFRPPDGGPPSLVIDVARLELRAGELVALEGTSGSGKTTLLHTIAGILTPDRGRVVIAGEEMTGRSEAARDRLRARRVGYVFQSFHLLQGYTALENVTLAMAFAASPGGARPREARARELLARVGLDHRLHYRPRQLSAGQQQRVAVARALANAPAVVLADEPTGNLDAASAQETLKLLLEICGESGAALMLVSHDAAVLNALPRRLRLSDLRSDASASSTSPAEPSR